VFHWSAQRHPGGEDNRPGGARQQYAELGHSPDARQHARLGQGPDAWQQLEACATRKHALSGPCIRGATVFGHWIGPGTLSDISLRQRQPAQRRPSHAQCFAGRPGDIRAVKTTGQAEHACSMPRLGTAPTPGSNPRPARLRSAPSAASAFEAPQPSATTQGLNLKLNGWPSHTHRSEGNRPGRDRLQEQAQRITGWPSDTHRSGDNRPVKVRLRHVRLGPSPDARQQSKACATRMHALSGLCVRGATAFVHRIGPASLSDTSLR
jgi:hypothetical protein